MLKCFENKREKTTSLTISAIFSESINNKIIPYSFLVENLSRNFAVSKGAIREKSKFNIPMLYIFIKEKMLQIPKKLITYTIFER